MDEPVDVVLELHKRAETGELGHLAFHEIADLVFLVDVLPRVFAQLFNAEADALVRLVDVDNFGFDFFALFQDFARLIDLLRPAQVGDVNHSVDAFIEFDERAVSGHVADLAFHAAADGEFLLDLVPRIRLELTQAERNFLFLLIYAEHDGLDFLAHGQNVGRTHVPFRPRKFGDVDETFHAFLEFHERAIRNEVCNFAFDLLTRGKSFFNLVPRIFLRLLQA